MAKPPEAPRIPTLTRLIRPAAASRAGSGRQGDPGVPRPAAGPLPEDLDIDLQLDALDALDTPTAFPPAPLEPIVPPSDYPATHDLRARIETMVDEALAAHIPALREQLVKSVLRALSEPAAGSRGKAPGED
jgi:hypothetical protein